MVIFDTINNLLHIYLGRSESKWFKLFSFDYYVINNEQWMAVYSQLTTTEFKELYVPNQILRLYTSRNAYQPWPS